MILVSVGHITGPACSSACPFVDIRITTPPGKFWGDI